MPPWGWKYIWIHRIMVLAYRNIPHSTRSPLRSNRHWAMSISSHFSKWQQKFLHIVWRLQDDWGGWYYGSYYWFPCGSMHRSWGIYTLSSVGRAAPRVKYAKGCRFWHRIILSTWACLRYGFCWAWVWQSFWRIRILVGQHWNKSTILLYRSYYWSLAPRIWGLRRWVDYSWSRVCFYTL